MNLKEHILNTFPSNNLELLKKEGFPTTKNEEWKYTSMKEVLEHSFEIQPQNTFNLNDFETYFIEPKCENILIFVNGIFQKNSSRFNQKQITVSDLSSKEFQDQKEHFSKYKNYNNDGFIALNQGFSQNGVFLQITQATKVSDPVYIYHFANCKNYNSLAIPHIAISLEQNSDANFVETFIKIGENISLTDSIIEFVVHENATGKYYKVLDEGTNANHVGTTQINQIGKSEFSTATYILSGSIVRNNLNFVLLKDYSVSNLFGLTLLQGISHVDNHTVVDHAMPNCESSELYKAILDENSTSVFNGKIFVRQDAQKTNAYQSSKNILLSNSATAYSKPQLEIWADDVKCSHGHATGQLNKDHLFYLKARGIGEKVAMKMLTKAYAQDVLNAINIEVLKLYLEEKIEKRFDS